jgi:uncharacterized protein (TIGR02996 family)
MNDESALFEAILAEPEDQALRLIYADLMEEQGETPRAEFIRLQCELARLPLSAPQRPALEAREAALLAAHRRYWNGALHRHLSRGPLRGQAAARRAPLRRWAYRRGFVEGLWVQASTFLDYPEVLFQLGPIRHVRLSLARLWIARLADCPHLSRLLTLGLRGNSLAHEDVLRLAASPYLYGLTRLDLSENPVSLTSVQRLRAAPRLRPEAVIDAGRLSGGVWHDEIGRAALPLKSVPPDAALRRWLHHNLELPE